MIETERVIDKLLKFDMASMFDGDARKKHTALITNLCQVLVTIGKKDLDSKWDAKIKRFGDFIDAGIERLDTYHEYIIKELEDESNN